MPKTILSISRDQILLETRGAILRKSGHEVVSVSSPEELAQALRKQPIDLVIVGHTLRAGEREETYRHLRDFNCEAPVIELYAQAAPPSSPAQFQLPVHDRTFPADLLSLVRQVLSSSTN